MAKKRGRKKGGSKKKDRKSKAKRRKFISKISRDGKISKKEGRKAAKKNISLRKIRNRRISDSRKAGRDFDRNQRTRARNPGASRPTYEPLKIKRGAQQADDRLSGRSRSRSEPKSRSRPKSRSSSSSAPTSNYASQADDLMTTYDDQLSDIMGGDYGSVMGGEENVDPLTFQYAASSLVEPGNNLTIGAATDAEKTSSTDKFKRRRKKRGNRLLKQIKKQRSNFGGFTGTAPAAAASAAAPIASTFGNI